MMKIKKSVIIIILLLLLLLPGNIMLAVYLLSNYGLAVTRWDLKADDNRKLQLLNPNFAITAHPKHEENAFYCVTPHNLVGLSCLDKRGFQVQVMTEKNVFEWSVMFPSQQFIAIWNDKMGYDFNHDLIFDYCGDATGSYIREQGHWLPVKTVDFKKNIAIMPDNSQRIWRHNNWETVPKPTKK